MGTYEVSVSTEMPAWDEYLGGRPDATLFHDARWGEIMRRTYASRCYYLTARRGDVITGVLQLVAKRSLLFGSHLCSLSYFDASGILADTQESADLLVAEAGALRDKLNCRWVELRQQCSLDDALPARTDKVTVRLPLPESSEALWNQLKPKVRNQVRKAESYAHNRGVSNPPEFFVMDFGNFGPVPGHLFQSQLY